MRCLPVNKWGPKITVTEEAQDLKALSLGDLFGKLNTHEILHKDGNNDVTPSMKNLLLKAKKEEEISSEKANTDDEKDPFAHII